jgi:hypothetical protein
MGSKLLVGMLFFQLPACGGPLKSSLLPDALIHSLALYTCVLPNGFFPLFTAEAFFSREHSLKRPGTGNYFLKPSDR